MDVKLVADYRHQMGFAIDGAILAMMMKGGTFQIDSEIPEDAEYMGVTYMADRDQYWIKFQHNSFDPLPHGGCIPVRTDGIQVIQITEDD